MNLPRIFYFLLIFSPSMLMSQEKDETIRILDFGKKASFRAKYLATKLKNMGIAAKALGVTGERIEREILT